MPQELPELIISYLNTRTELAELEEKIQGAIQALTQVTLDLSKRDWKHSRIDIDGLSYPQAAIGYQSVNVSRCLTMEELARLISRWHRLSENAQRLRNQIPTDKRRWILGLSN